MAKYSPPYTITPTIVNLIAEISELLGVWSAQGVLSSPQLRRDNRIRTIQASLAIEYNSLSTQQVTAIMDGKRVLAPARDIQEVRNAIVTYEKLPYLQFHNIDHLLEAHAGLMMGLVDFAGQWRKELAWLPVETIVCENQESYYQALGEADKTSDCTGFIDFMLRAISDSLQASITGSFNQHHVGKSVGKMSEENGPVYLNKTASKLLKIRRFNTNHC